MLEFSHVSPQDDRNLNPRFPVVAGRVDMQLVGHLYRLVVWLIYIPEIGAHRFARHESLSILRSEGASVCVDISPSSHAPRSIIHGGASAKVVASGLRQSGFSPNFRPMISQPSTGMVPLPYYIM